jgi:hypothetical protein
MSETVLVLPGVSLALVVAEAGRVVVFRVRYAQPLFVTFKREFLFRVKSSEVVLATVRNFL